MANRPSLSDFREKVLKEGVLKHRQSSIALPRWRPRYVVFKVTSSGRYQFIIYKEQPMTPANEVKEVPIEEFGGLDINAKIDSEKNTFAVITTSTTDCFSTDSPDEMVKWTRVLQEYLGKELVVNITIPHKQNMLKSGRAQMRIRNTGFTITTCDTPPRCQGIWQIIHIRKFGGSDNFRFETGSKCPTGEYRYTICTDSNDRLKSLFHDLSEHKPIFTDDRLGRRMTLERHNKDESSAGRTRTDGRYSLQCADSSAPMYENRSTITDTFQRNAADPVNISPPGGRRHSAVDERILSPLRSRAVVSNGSPRAARSIEDLSAKLHVQHGGRRSPTKRVSSPLTSVASSDDLPVDYYSVVPPRALRKFRASSASPPEGSSPVDGGFVGGEENALSRKKSPPISEEEDDDQEAYVHFTPGCPSSPVKLLSLRGDSVVIRRDSARIPPQQPSSEAHYENFEFKKPNASFPESQTSSSKVATASAQTTESTWLSSHPGGNELEYTNVQDVRKAMHHASASPIRPISSLKAKPQHHSFKDGSRPHREPIQHPAITTMSSAPVFVTEPPFGRNRSGAISIKKVTSPMGTSTPIKSSVLRSSHSNFEHIASSKRANTVTLQSPSSPAEYYNSSAPFLPANLSPNDQAEASLGVQHSDVEGKGHNPRTKYASSKEVMMTESDRAESDVHPAYYDHLEIRRASESPRSPDSPLEGNEVDGLDPASSESEVTAIEQDTTPQFSPTGDNRTPLSNPISPEPLTPYERKISSLGTWGRHSYEYIDVALKDTPINKTPLPTASTHCDQSSGDRSGSPECKQLPSDWFNSARTVRRPHDYEQLDEVDAGSQTDQFEAASKLRKKPIALPRRRASQLQSSSNDDTQTSASTSESDIVECNSTTEQAKRPSSLLSDAESGGSSRSSSPCHRSTHEFIALKPKIQSVRVETVQNATPQLSEISPASITAFGIPPRPPKHASNKESSPEITAETPRPSSPRPLALYDLPPNPIRSSSNRESQFSRSEELAPPPIPPRPTEFEENELSLSLPEACIGFDKPAVPPRPYILNAQGSDNVVNAGPTYVAVEFLASQPNLSPQGSRNPISVDAPVQTATNSLPLPSSSIASSTSDGIVYQSIDYNMTVRLARMITEVGDQRTRQREYIESAKKSSS